MPITREQFDELDEIPETLYTQDDLAEKEQLLEAREKELEEARAEAEKYKRVSAEKTENFKKLNEMSQEEREALTANQIAEMRRNEALESEIEQLKTQIGEKEKAEYEYNKSQLLKEFYGSDEELKKSLEENWELINLQGVDQETMRIRAQKAALMAGISTNTPNPLNASVSGSAPNLKQVNQSDEKVDEAIKIARQQLGLADKKES